MNMHFERNNYQHYGSDIKKIFMLGCTFTPHVYANM